MNTNKEVLVLGYRRPDYLRRSLEALDSCRGVADYGLTISIDGPPNPTTRACFEVVEMFDARKFARFSAVQHGQNHGINWHNAKMYDSLFGGGVDQLVCVEDDAVLTPDALEMASWFFDDLADSARYAFLSLGCLAREMKHPGKVDEFVGLGTSWAYCLTRATWHTLRPWWNHKVDYPVGWDWALTRALHIEGMVALQPQVSRVENIGREGGVNAYPEWFDANMLNLVKSEGSWRGGYEVDVKLAAYPTSLPDWAKSETGGKREW